MPATEEGEVSCLQIAVAVHAAAAVAGVVVDGDIVAGQGDQVGKAGVGVAGGRNHSPSDHCKETLQAFQVDNVEGAVVGGKQDQNPVLHGIQRNHV